MTMYKRIERNKFNRIIFSSRFKEECARLNKSMNQIERELGYPRNALHNYKYGAIPSGERLIEIAKYLGVTPEYLIGETSHLDQGKMEIFFKNLSLKDKQELCKVCQKWLLSSVYK